ncbi:MAG: hypothetical protein ABJA66_13445 [Actinomycetota bacterium]
MSKKVSTFFLFVMIFAFLTNPLKASDHLDTPTVTADPAADIGDLYSWVSSDGRRLNLVMTIVAHQFSDRVQYVFHVDSGARFGKTTTDTTILCRFNTENMAECWAGDRDHVRGDASNPAGLAGDKRRFQVFAGLRDDPFFNNVKGTRAALNTAALALRDGTKTDAAGCPNFDVAASQTIFDRWRHTADGPPTNFLAGWKSAAIVISVDLGIVNAGGKELAVWAGTYKMPDEKKSPNGNRMPLVLGAPIDRIGRALTANMLLGPLDTDDVSDQRKEDYNRASPNNWSQFSADIERTLGLFDGYDGRCGNQWLAGREPQSSKRYQSLAKMLADDRLWINSQSKVCNQYLAVELSTLTNPGSPGGDCGGRTPNYNANAVFRSLLVRGTIDGDDDGLKRDDAVHSTSVFPFLAPPKGETTGKSNGDSVFKSPTDTKVTFNALLTTNGSIALNNLDYLIAQRQDEVGAVELLLARSRFLGDYEALDQALKSAENHIENGDDLLRRSRARSAVHRFKDALDDLIAAENAGADHKKIEQLRDSILVATGQADEAIPKLESQTADHPTFASQSSLANAYAAIGRFNDADRLYSAALTKLDTTSPFPYAWIYFARGVMWSEQAGDKPRGEKMYALALDYLPEFAAANVHLAEIEIARGKLPSAMARLKRVAAATEEPEALALLGEILIRSGESPDGLRQISRARQRFESLLAGQTLAFADHAAKFFLGPGNDAERAWTLAQKNLVNRETRESFALAIRSAQATGRKSEMCALVTKARVKFGVGFYQEGCSLQTAILGAN